MSFGRNTVVKIREKIRKVHFLQVYDIVDVVINTYNSKYKSKK